MGQVKGKFFKMAGSLMMKHELDKANDYLKGMTGATHLDLEDDGWYETSIFDSFLNIPAQMSVNKDYTYVIVGKRVYPTIKKTVGLPAELKTPLDFLKYEAQGFLMNHKGDDVVPRKFIKVDNKEVIVQAKSPGYNNRLFEGVFLGILEMCGINSGKVERQPNDVFKITWR